MPAGNHQRAACGTPCSLQQMSGRIYVCDPRPTARADNQSPVAQRFQRPATGQAAIYRHRLDRSTFFAFVAVAAEASPARRKVDLDRPSCHQRDRDIMPVIHRSSTSPISYRPPACVREQKEERSQGDHHHHFYRRRRRPRYARPRQASGCNSITPSPVGNAAPSPARRHPARQGTAGHTGHTHQIPGQPQRQRKLVIHEYNNVTTTSRSRTMR